MSAVRCYHKRYRYVFEVEFEVFVNRAHVQIVRTLLTLSLSLSPFLSRSPRPNILYSTYIHVDIAVSFNFYVTNYITTDRP